jgi:type IV secretory pathway VirB10-like protein
MSRWVVVALACAAGVLVWTIATWPVQPELASSEEPAAAESEPIPQTESAAALPPTAATDPAPTAQPPEALAQAPAAPPEASEDSAEAQADKVFIRENGPLADYKAQFNSEPRDSAANEAEQLVRSAFNPKDGARPVFRSVLCRETICKIETRLSTETLGAYVAAMARVIHAQFDHQLATERTSLTEAGEVSVTVYAKRPAAAE